MDDFDNPGMLFVDIAQDAWDTVEGTAEKSCASCHGDVEDSMMGVKTEYPKWIESAGEVRSIDMQINNCRTAAMGAEPWKLTGSKMTAMNALVTVQSRGMAGLTGRPRKCGCGARKCITPALVSWNCLVQIAMKTAMI